MNGEGVEAIGDFATCHDAGEIYSRITGQPFTGSYQAGPRLRLMHAAPALLAALEAFIEVDELAEECREWKWENLDHAFTLARTIIATVKAA